MNLSESYNYLKENIRVTPVIKREAKRRKIQGRSGRSLSQSAICAVVQGKFKNKELEKMIIELAEKYKEFFEMQKN